MADHIPPPSRDDVAARWRALIDGNMTREDIHAWAAQWVGNVPISDPMVDTALLYLHGFGLTVGPNPSHPTDRTGDDYLHSDQDIVLAFERWQADCTKYDTDPERFRREKRAAAQAYLERERREKGTG
ncbi:hypothetical protein ACTWP5_18770 [Streptomyces sp. 4N509B]|uniref:hypothetical protein n=1 Tax=Streptomyces sp. 4N509B TaxID=3457413 RepID=UPI003FD0FB6A